MVHASAGNHGLGRVRMYLLRRAAQILFLRTPIPQSLAAYVRWRAIEIRVVDGSYDDAEVAGRERAAGPVFIWSSTTIA